MVDYDEALEGGGRVGGAPTERSADGPEKKSSMNG